MRRLIGLNLVVAVITLLAATAADARPKVEVRPFLGMRFGGTFSGGTYEDFTEDLEIAPDKQYGVNLNVPLGIFGMAGEDGQKTQLEFMFNYSEGDLRFEPANIDDIPMDIRDRFEEDDGKLILATPKIMYIHGGVLYQFTTTGWMPYVNLGLGATIFDASEAEFESISKFSVGFGGGVKKMFNETFGSRLQLKGYFTSLPADEYWCDEFGCWEYTESNSFFQGEFSGGVIIAF